MGDLIFLRSEEFGKVRDERGIDVFPRAGMGVVKVACDSTRCQQSLFPDS